MAAFKAFGSWLEDSEWTSVLVNAQVTSPGTADSFLKASPVTTTRRTHQVTACTLYRLLSNAYCQYKDVLRYDEVILEFEEWCLELSKQSPHFKFWYITLKFELTLLIFIRSIRANPSMPSPDLFGWQKLDGTWVPFLSVLADASMSCQDLIHCKKGCRGAYDVCMQALWCRIFVQGENDETCEEQAFQNHQDMIALFESPVKPISALPSTPKKRKTETSKPSEEAKSMEEEKKLSDERNRHLLIPKNDVLGKRQE
ncbi:unnamed protein product [Mytilus edulis]|uniref:Uncharacterized protein n=1 Tax=Mytilus edulis TaxID=6550 RepID=A0A8S3VCG8_MYTED|nr:unnamed protein product [Mytilus edulis]